MQFIRLTLLMLIPALALSSHGQDHYAYSVDLTALENDRLTVELTVPAVVHDSAIFCLPRIVPGIYGAMDHGRLVEELHAFDARGETMPVERTGTNCWRTSGEIHRITYIVNDGWEEFDRHLKDLESTSQGYYRSSEGTFKDSVFVINHNAMFGYFRGHEELPFEIRMTMPGNTYAATSLERGNAGGTMLFKAPDYRSLVDAPMLIAPPDTAHIPLDDINVLVAVHSTSGRPMAHAIAEHIRPLLQDQRAYLGGSLPVDRYTFLIYHHPETLPDSWTGDGLEHAGSTLILLHSPTDAEAIKEQVYNIASHEFFHTILPLSVRSEEIAFYDFQEPEMSRHLWLYEGMTEYFAMHMPVRQGRMGLEEFLGTVERKIHMMRNFTDSIAMTELSKHAMERQDQFSNFYLKGTLFCMGLDIALREWSAGERGVVWLVNELRERHGPDRPFKDDGLFDVIQTLTTPAIGEMLHAYLEQPAELPLRAWLSRVGLRLDEHTLRISVDPTAGEAELRGRHWWVGGQDGR